MSTQLILLLRERLSRTDARDITDDFGSKAGLGDGLYDRIAEGGLDERIDALVKRAKSVDKLDLLVAIVHVWRPDLDGKINTAIAQDRAVQTINAAKLQTDSTGQGITNSSSNYGAQGIFNGPVTINNNK